MAKRTLIVSPDPGLVRQIRGVLEARGVLVHSASSGKEAQDAAQAAPTDLVIAEVDLPGGSGYDLCRFLKASARPPKVMLLFTAGEGSAERNAFECGADDSVRRPFLTSQFLEHLVPMVGPEFFGLRGVSEAPSVPPEMRGPGSIVDAATGLFSDGIAPLDSQSLDALESGAVQNLSRRTQELPPLNIEQFDEENPVSVPVGAFATAHAIPVVNSSSVSVDVSIDDSLDDSLESPGSLDSMPGPFETDRVSALGRHTSRVTPAEESGLPSAASLREAARVRRAVDAHLDELLQPGGRLASLLEQTVDRAVSRALERAIPVATAAAARILAGGDDD